MFGSKKRKLEEQIRLNEIISEVAQQRDNLKSSVGQIENVRERISTDLKQAEENTDVLTKHADTNVLAESDLIHNMDDFSKRLKAVEQEYRKLLDRIGEQQDATITLVEKNKLYTNASRRLMEAPEELRKNVEAYEKQLEIITGYDSRIGVLALNAAIEAGHMGAAGIPFVSAVEEIRQIVIEQGKAASALLEEITVFRTQMEEYEECIRYMIGLIKESNIATNSLFKKGQELKMTAQPSIFSDFSKDMVLMRDQIVGIRNLDEEILKCGERNKIQFNDMQEDIQAQQVMLTELEDSTSNIN